MWAHCCSVYRELCYEDFFSYWVNWVVAEQSRSAAMCLHCDVWKKEISQHRKWVGRNYPFKLLPSWDFRDTIMASDKLFGTQSTRLRIHFLPHVCLLICLCFIHPLLGILLICCLELQSDARMIKTLILGSKWQISMNTLPIFTISGRLQNPLKLLC